MSVDPNLLREILLRARYLVAHLPPELQQEGLDRLHALIGRIRPLLGQPEPIPLEQPEGNEPPSQPPSPQLPIPDIARHLWALARGNPDIFSLYMRSYPNDQVQAIGNNPTQLNAVMNGINNTQSIPPLGQADGVNQAPLQSSNVYGFRYDPLQKKLTVRFNEGSVYRYQGVPRVIFDMFAAGEGVARTTGSNRWGRWWKGKSPSLGSALHELIKLGGFPYTRVR